MPRPRLLVGLDAPPAPRSPQARRLRALARACDLTLCAASPARSAAGARWAAPAAEAFWISLSRAAASAGAAAAVLLDGPAVRAALRPGRFDDGLRVALWADADTQAEADAAAPLRSPAAAYAGRAWPDEIWWTGPRGTRDPSEFLPEAFRTLDEASAGKIAADFARSPLARPARARGLTTIVIPCWNNLPDTRRCLRSVLRHTGVPFEVVLVDNGSADGTVSFARSLNDPRVRVISHETNRGFAHAVNRGLLEARGPYAVWLNNDCVVGPDWLALLQDALERAPWIGAVGPVSHGVGGFQRAWGAPPDPRRFAEASARWSVDYRGQMLSAHRLVGYCLLHRTELLRRAGFIDERFHPGCYEDFDWCLRARQAGSELYVAQDVLVAHREHATFGANGLSYDAACRRNRAVFVEKWCRRGLEFLDDVNDSIPHRPRTRRN